MKRRDFIKSGMAAMVAGASAPSAFGEILIPTGNNITQAEMERFISELDVRMDRIAHSGGEYLKEFTSQNPDETAQKLFRSNLRSLLLIGSFSELPVKGQAHPWMQKRMRHSAPEVDFSVFNSFEILKNLSEEAKGEIKDTLANDPGLSTRIMDALDLEARSIGVSSARRRQMKVMGNRILRRMRHSPEMLIDEYVKKTEKLLLASNSDEAFDRMFRMQVGESNYDACMKEAEAAAIQWKNLNIPDDSIAYDSLTGEGSDFQDPVKPEGSKPSKGLRLLGIGALITVIGLIILNFEISFWLGAILGITVGPILILIALLVLMITSSRNAKQQ